MPFSWRAAHPVSWALIFRQQPESLLHHITAGGMALPSGSPAVALLLLPPRAGGTAFFSYSVFSLFPTFTSSTFSPHLQKEGRKTVNEEC